MRSLEGLSGETTARARPSEIEQAAAQGACAKILILAPLRNDANLTAEFLSRAGMAAECCRSVADLRRRADTTCGALLIAEEALNDEAIASLGELLVKQPRWSDLPIVIITSNSEPSQSRRSQLGVFGQSGNIALIERPFRPATLISTMEVALRARRRQFQVRDLLEQIRQDAEVLRASEERYRKLAEETKRQARIFETTLASTLDLLYVFDLEGRFLYGNRRLLSSIGQPAEAVFGKSFAELNYPPDVAAKLARQVKQVIDTRQPVRDTTDYTGTQGVGTYEYIFSPVLTDEGEVEAVAGVTRDITEREEVEQALAAQAAALREADQRKDEFLAMLAHELRNPLSSVANAVTLLKEDTHIDSRDWASNVIERQTRQLARLVDDLLDVSRITRGKIELRRELMDAARCLESACEAVAPLISERRHTLTTDIPRDELWLHADPTRLEQIVVNLLANAAKYTEPGGQISLEAHRAQDEIVIHVRDSGLGLAPENIPAMFELFAQGERSVARSEGGLGIGLTVVRGLCELHGGTVSAQSDGVGTGSTFTVRLPAAERPDLSQAAVCDDTSSTEGAGRRVLVVDDNVDTATGLARLLTRRGYIVQVAYDGNSALEAARKLSPAIILLDIGLPGIDGYDVARHLRADPRCTNALVIALSGYGQDEDRRRSRAAGFDHHLVKPVSFDEVRTLLAQRL